MLIKSTVQNLSVYLLSCRLVPVKVIDEIGKLIKRFQWGAKDGKKKNHLVSFEGMCLLN